MDNAPEAPAAMPAESEATPITNPTSAPAESPAQAPAPDMHGFTSDQLADIDKFFKANGGFDAIKSKISNPQPVSQPSPTEPTRPSWEQPSQQQQPQYQEPMYRAPEGSITAQEFLAQQYFQALSREEKYAGISDKIATGDVLKEMASFNIQPLNQDGSINDQMVRRYLDLKAQTVPAKATSAEPSSSTAPTVEYVEVGENISNIDQAYQVLSQDAKLRSQGLAGHPKIALAEAFIKEQLSKKK
jgi:hypothetical protein